MRQGDTTQKFRSSAATGLAVVSLANLLNYFDRGIFNLMLEPIKKEFGFNNTSLGVLAGAFALLFAFMSLPLAWAADKTRRLTVIGVAITIWSVATAVSGLATSFWQLFAARVGVGIGEAGCLPAGTSLVGDHFPPAKRPRAMAVYQGTGLVGSMLGLVLVGMLADRTGWRHALVYASLPGLLLAPVALWLREPVRGRFDMPGSADQPWFEALGMLFRSPAYLMLLGGITCVSLGFSTIGTWGPTFFVRSFGLSLTQVGFAFGLAFGFSAAVGAFLGGYVTSRLVLRDRRWEFWVPSGACALAVPLYEVAFSLHSATASIAAMALASLVAFLCYGPIMSVYHVVAPPAARATAAAVGACGAGIVGSFGGPVIVGRLTDAFTPAYGPDALRHALEVVIFVLLIPAALYGLASTIAFRRERVSGLV